ncbi:response regulator [Undibacterium parvum]|uniref:Response regulator n=1 Tax=Undibacterium parvum TaxID=401471 RepID=A0A3S9HMD7_9BURK|nr:response regulator [Undibacterium parvum]AZP13261.1 response regulator [Undibacterium parvum]
MDNSSTKPSRILIVEDDPKIAALLADYFVASGYLVECLADGISALAQIRQDAPDLLLLDLMLPGLDGLELCKQVRTFSQLPIIMLTAKVDEIDRLLGLESGADDYVCKPFSPREVVARAKVHLRRHSADAGRQNTPAAMAANSPATPRFVVDHAQMRILIDATALPLTPVEFRLLGELISHPDRVYSRQQLLDFAHEDQRDINDRTIDSHIKNIRKKILSRLPDSDYLQSVYGVGYRFELPF